MINLVALRTLTSDMNLKRYLLGLALVALSFRDEQCFNLREGCLLRAASKDDYDGAWTSVNFDGTDARETIAHDIALEYAKAACRDIAFEAAEPNDFDKETAEAWLAIDKKERKSLAKTMHPTEALARKRKKQADENAKNPVDAALKTLKTIKLGARPKQGKPPKIQTDKFEALKNIFEPLIDDISAEVPLKTMASEIIALIHEDQDSHVLHEELTKKLEDFNRAQSAEPNDESAITTEEEAAQ